MNARIFPLWPAACFTFPIFVCAALLGQSSGAPKGAVAPSNPLPPAPAAAAAPASTHPVTVEDIVARVNDQIITDSDLARADTQLQQDARQQNLTPLDIEDRRKNLLRDLIDQQLLLSKGKELGITGDAELIRRLDEIRKQNHLEAMEDLEKAAKEQGVSYEDFKAGIRNNIITQQVVRDEVGRHLQVSRADVQAYYDAHKSQFAQPESERLSEILLGGQMDDAAAQAASLKKAQDLKAQLDKGADFDVLAKANSTGPTAVTGGDLGTFKRGGLAKELEDKTYPLQVGGVSDPILTKQGYILLKVTAHTPGGTPELKDVEQEVQEAMFMERMNPALRAYLTKLREQAYIDRKPGFVDTGASSRETKPVYSAYVPPAPKKKRVVQKTRFNGKQRYSRRPKQDGADGSEEVQTAVAVPGPNTPAAGSASGTASTAPPQQTASAKPNRKTPKEKIRFGQAPRHSLPEATDTSTAATSDAGAGTGAPTATPEPGSGLAGQSPSGTEVASAGTVPDAAVNQQQGAKQPKSRYSSRLKLPKEQRAKLDNPDAGNDVVAPPTAEEVATRNEQSGPLGLSGDTSKKPKPVKVKGEKKTRYSATTPKPKEEPIDNSNLKQELNATGAATPAPAARPAPASESGQGTPATNGGNPATNPPTSTNPAANPASSTPPQ